MPMRRAPNGGETAPAPALQAALARCSCPEATFEECARWSVPDSADGGGAGPRSLSTEEGVKERGTSPRESGGLRAPDSRGQIRGSSRERLIPLVLGGEAPRPQGWPERSRHATGNGAVCWSLQLTSITAPPTGPSSTLTVQSLPLLWVSPRTASLHCPLVTPAHGCGLHGLLLWEALAPTPPHCKGPAVRQHPLRPTPAPCAPPS